MTFLKQNYVMQLEEHPEMERLAKKKLQSKICELQLEEHPEMERLANKRIHFLVCNHVTKRPCWG